VVDFEAEVFRAVRRKGGKILPVYFNVDVTIALRRWLWQRKEYPNATTNPALFLSDRGLRLSARAVEDLVGKYAKLVGIDKHVTPHVLRHYLGFLTMSSDMGQPVALDRKIRVAAQTWSAYHPT
jgi:site-specific recombinase XerD